MDCGHSLAVSHALRCSAWRRTQARVNFVTGHSGSTRLMKQLDLVDEELKLSSGTAKDLRTDPDVHQN